MDSEIVTLSEISQTERDKYHMISVIYRILKNGYKSTIYRNRATDIENKHMVTRGKG